MSVKDSFFFFFFTSKCKYFLCRSIELNLGGTLFLTVKLVSTASLIAELCVQSSGLNVILKVERKFFFLFFFGQLPSPVALSALAAISPLSVLTGSLRLRCGFFLG